MFDWVNSQATFAIAFVGLIVLGVVVRRWRNRMMDRAVHNVQNGITAGGTGNPHFEKMILSQSVELHLDTSIDRAAQLLANVRMPMLLGRIGLQAWGDRTTAAESSSYGVLEPTATGTRARMLWCQDSSGMPTIEGDWRALRKRLTKAAEAAGIAVTEQQAPRLTRVPLGDLPSHLRPEQASLADHRWQAAES